MIRHGHGRMMDEADVIRLELPATHKYLNVLGACITEMLSRVDGLQAVSVVAYNVQLAVHETCTNIVEHAYGGAPDGRIAITLTLTSAPRLMVVDVHDTGRSFDPSSVPDPDLERGQIHGYGIFLVHSLMDDVAYETQADGNHWRLVKHL